MIHQLPTIIIDTREQLPYDFTGYQSRVATLGTGDYSLEGYEGQLAVERKSKEDAYSCVGANRKRFVECLERLSCLERSAVVIECDLPDFAIPPARTIINARQAVGSYVAWSCYYRIPVFWCGSREYAERVTVRFLAAYATMKSQPPPSGSLAGPRRRTGPLPGVGSEAGPE